MRLDKYLGENHQEYSRSTWQKVIERGLITVNGKVASSVNEKVSDRDKIVIDKSFENQVTDIDLPVIYEDDNVIVVNKPAGVLTHSKGVLNDEFTVSDFVKMRCHPELDSEPAPDSIRGSSHNKSATWILKQVQNDKYTNNRFGIVHRLDRGTSGVIICAKNEETAKLLQKQFQDRKVKKTYLALVEKTPKELKAKIDLPIWRNPKHPSQFRVDAKGKSAVTDYEVKKVLDDGRALVELKPLTGRTHQLRVHLAYIGAPIVGDVVYGKQSATWILGQAQNDKRNNRMMLHAAELEITIPDGQRKVFKAPLPREFKDSETSPE